MIAVIALRTHYNHKRFLSRTIKHLTSGYQRKQGLHRLLLMLNMTKKIFLAYGSKRQSMVQITFS